ncbi:MAG TPA: hypothetical protein VGN04_06760 [Herbaspirillum sp.]|jgi:hypothetical protein
MATRRVDPVCAVNAVGRIRAITSGNTYYRQLELWRITSEVNAHERRIREARLLAGKRKK